MRWLLTNDKTQYDKYELDDLDKVIDHIPTDIKNEDRIYESSEKNWVVGKGIIPSWCSKWIRPEDKDSVKQILKEVNLLPDKDWDKITDTVYTKLSYYKGEIIDLLSWGYWYAKMLGNKNELKFECPRQIDQMLGKMSGLECVETTYIDIMCGEIGITNKGENNFFHTECRIIKPNHNTKGGLVMSNFRPGSNADSIPESPVFDILLVYQKDPFLVLGISPYNSTHEYIKETKSGYVMDPIPMKKFKYIISPEEYLEPLPLSDKCKERMQIEVNRMKEPVLFEDLKRLGDEIK